jgi:hypothetical protein
MSQPEPSPQPQEAPGPLELICVECGELISVRDPAGMIRALHLVNECAVRALLSTQE